MTDNTPKIDEYQAGSVAESGTHRLAPVATHDFVPALVHATELVGELLAEYGEQIVGPGDRLLELNRVLWQMRWALCVLPAHVEVAGCGTQQGDDS